MQILRLKSKFAVQDDDNDCDAGNVELVRQMVPPSGATIVKTSSGKTRFNATLLWSGLLMLGSLATTGCQMDIAGQTLPSGYYLSDDVQYYAPGPEFKLAREAAALKEQSANNISEPQQ